MISTIRESITCPTTDILSCVFAGNPASIKSKEHPIWVDSYNPKRYLDFNTAKSTIRQLIRGLRQHGLQKGDVVCLHSFNNIWYPAIQLAIIGAGAVFVGSNPAYKSTELSHLFSSSRTKYLIVESSQAARVLPVSIDAGISQHDTFILDEDNDINPEVQHLHPLQSWNRLLDCGQDDWIIFDDLTESQSTPAIYLSSSGTTGLPKIVVMSHYAITAQITLSNYQVQHVPSEIRRLITLPFFHSFTLPFPILSLYRRESLYIMPRFSTNAYLQFIDDYKITMTAVVPPMAKALFGPSQSDLKISQLSSLTEIICAGAPMDEITQKSLAKNLPSSTRITQIWGMSETGWLTTFRHPEPDLTASIGRQLPGVSVKLIDEMGDTISDWTNPGEICVQTPGLMMGYLGKERTTNDMFAGDYLRTGDIARCEAGKWYIVDRAKDIIKVRAWQVSPVEIEFTLLKHPAVKDAAVIGVPDELSGEQPRAFIVTTDNLPASSHTTLANDLKHFVAKNLASYKSLTGGVVFVDEIPRHISGKILRRMLRQYVSVAV